MQFKLFFCFLILGYASCDFEGNKIIQIDNNDSEPDVHVTSPDNGVKVHIVMKRFVEDGLIGTEIMVIGPNFVKKTIELTDPEGGRKFIAHIFEKHIGVVDANTFNHLLENIVQAVRSNNIHPAFYHALRITNVQDLNKLNPEDIFDRIVEPPNEVPSSSSEQESDEKELKDTLQNLDELEKDKEDLQVAEESLKQKIGLDKDVIQEKEINGDDAAAQNAIGDLLDKQATVEDLNDLLKKVEGEQTKLVESVSEENLLPDHESQENSPNRNGENPFRVKIINLGENTLPILQSPPILSQENNEPVLEDPGNGLNQDTKQVGADGILHDLLAFLQAVSGDDLNQDNHQNSQPRPNVYHIIPSILSLLKQVGSGDNFNQGHDQNSQPQTNMCYDNINPLSFLFPLRQSGSGDDLDRDNNQNSQPGAGDNAFNFLSPFLSLLKQVGSGDNFNQNSQPQPNAFFDNIIPPGLGDGNTFNPLSFLFRLKQPDSGEDDNQNIQLGAGDNAFNPLSPFLSLLKQVGSGDNAFKPLSSFLSFLKQVGFGDNLDSQPKPQPFNPLDFLFRLKQPGSGDGDNQNSQLGAGDNAFNPLSSILSLLKQAGSGDNFYPDRKSQPQQNNFIPFGPGGQAFNPLSFLFPLRDPGSGNGLNQEDKHPIAYHFKIVPLRPGTVFNSLASIFPWVQPNLGNGLSQETNENDESGMEQGDNGINPLNGLLESILSPNLGPKTPERAVQPDLAGTPGLNVI